MQIINSVKQLVYLKMVWTMNGMDNRDFELSFLWLESGFNSSKSTR